MEEKELKLRACIKYSICTCGYSSVLPLCDNAHKQINEKEGTNYRSLKIIPKDDIVIRVRSKAWDKEDLADVVEE